MDHSSAPSQDRTALAELRAKHVAMDVRIPRKKLPDRSYQLPTGSEHRPFTPVFGQRLLSAPDRPVRSPMPRPPPLSGWSARPAHPASQKPELFGPSVPPVWRRPVPPSPRRLPVSEASSPSPLAPRSRRIVIQSQSESEEEEVSMIIEPSSARSMVPQSPSEALLRREGDRETTKVELEESLAEKESWSQAEPTSKTVSEMRKPAPKARPVKVAVTTAEPEPVFLGATPAPQNPIERLQIWQHLLTALAKRDLRTSTWWRVTESLHVLMGTPLLADLAAVSQIVDDAVSIHEIMEEFSNRLLQRPITCDTRGVCQGLTLEKHRQLTSHTTGDLLLRFPCGLITAAPMSLAPKAEKSSAVRWASGLKAALEGDAITIEEDDLSHEEFQVHQFHVEWAPTLKHRAVGCCLAKRRAAGLRRLELARNTACAAFGDWHRSVKADTGGALARGSLPLAAACHPDGLAAAPSGWPATSAAAWYVAEGRLDRLLVESLGPALGVSIKKEKVMPTRQPPRPMLGMPTQSEMVLPDECALPASEVRIGDLPLVPQSRADLVIEAKEARASKLRRAGGRRGSGSSTLSSLLGYGESKARLLLGQAGSTTNFVGPAPQCLASSLESLGGPADFWDLMMASACQVERVYSKSTSPLETVIIWFAEELEKYIERLNILGRRFEQIADVLPSKSVEDCVRFYYRMKHTFLGVWENRVSDANDVIPSTRDVLAGLADKAVAQRRAYWPDLILMRSSRVPWPQAFTEDWLASLPAEVRQRPSKPSAIASERRYAMGPNSSMVLPSDTKAMASLAWLTDQPGIQLQQRPPVSLLLRQTHPSIDACEVARSLSLVGEAQHGVLPNEEADAIAELLASPWIGPLPLNADAVQMEEWAFRLFAARGSSRDSYKNQ